MFKFLKRKLSKIDYIPEPTTAPITPNAENIHDLTLTLTRQLLKHRHDFNQYSATQVFNTPGKSITEAVEALQIVYDTIKRRQNLRPIQINLPIVTQPYKDWFIRPSLTYAPGHDTMCAFLQAVEQVLDRMVQPDSRNESYWVNVRFMTTTFVFSLHKYLTELITSRTL